VGGRGEPLAYPAFRDRLDTEGKRYKSPIQEAKPPGGGKDSRSQTCIHTHTHTQVYLKWQHNNAEYKTQKHKKTHKAKQDSENTSVLTMTIELGQN